MFYTIWNLNENLKRKIEHTFKYSTKNRNWSQNRNFLSPNINYNTLIFSYEKIRIKLCRKEYRRVSLVRIHHDNVISSMHPIIPKFKIMGRCIYSELGHEEHLKRRFRFYQQRRFTDPSSEIRIERRPEIIKNFASPRNNRQRIVGGIAVRFGFFFFCCLKRLIAEIPNECKVRRTADDK